MSIKKEAEKRSKLSQEILGLLGVSAVVSIFFYGFFSVSSMSLIQAYSEQNHIFLDETREMLYHSWIQSISIGIAGILFVVLFLTLVGRKITYLKEIIRGIESLRTHRMDYEIPLEGNNELTELAESINYLSQTELELQEKEKQIQVERETFIRTMSHDIRTPLTTIVSYSEYMKEKEHISKQELDDYITLMGQKAYQIKALTDQLLDNNRVLEMISNGRLLMEQLADEWLSFLEDEYPCKIDLDSCPDFACEVNIQELRRIFDNLISNVEKYADLEKEVSLSIYNRENRLAIWQKNYCKVPLKQVESYKLGLESIRKIAEQYGGDVTVNQIDQEFEIIITLMEIK